MTVPRRINVFIRICCYFIVLFLFLLVTALTVSNYQAKGDPEYVPGVGPYKMLIVLSDSMKPVFAAGDVLFVDASGRNVYAEGDIIIFWRSRSPQMLLTHRITGLEEISGLKYYNTKGDANNAEDAVAVRQEEILGRYLFKVPLAGHLVSIVHTRLGFVLLVIMPLLLAGYYELRKHLLKNASQNRPGSNVKDINQNEPERSMP